MPSFLDSIFIFVLALLLFGPKKLPQLARQLGKMMAEFRRASNEFKMQMEEELRISERAEEQKKFEAATPEKDAAPAPIATSGDLSIMPPETGLPVPSENNAAIHSLVESIPSSETAPELSQHSETPAATDNAVSSEAAAATEHEVGPTHG
jgi:sec-independent protein translocase protein TatB